MNIDLPERFTPGTLVQSTQGHDRGRFYIVLDRQSDGRLCLTDGRAHGTGRPKVKNTKHVRSFGQLMEAHDAEALFAETANARESDTKIRQAIAQWVERHTYRNE
ncbi:MAG: hypothetical protein ACOYH4_01190 [Saccharofermentanales bacterium]|jgi:ribosomal protein L14E/L6E/L27E